MYRPRRRGRLFLLIFLALSILIITLDFRGESSGPLERAKDVTAAIVAPIQRGLNAVTRPVGNFFSSIGDLANLREENTRLKAQLGQLESDVNEARNLTSENDELREMLGLEQSWASMDRVAAQVIADSPANYRWAVTIDKGTNDGIRKDMAVITPAGLVGKVFSADAHQSVVLLIIDPTLGVGSTTEDRGLDGITAGRGEGADLALQYVSKEEDVNVGDRLMTSNYQGRTFPPGIPIGYVSRVGGDQRASDFEIDVDPYVDFFKLNFVYVLLGTGGDVGEGVATP